MCPNISITNVASRLGTPSQIQKMVRKGVTYRQFRENSLSDACFARASSHDPKLTEALANLEATLRQQPVIRNGLARACYAASACEGVKLKTLQASIWEKFTRKVSMPELHRLCSAGRVLSLSHLSQCGNALENLDVDRLAILSRLADAKLTQVIEYGTLGQKDVFKMERAERLKPLFMQNGPFNLTSNFALAL